MDHKSQRIPLQYCRRVLTWLCLYTIDNKTSKQAYVLFTMIITLVLMSCLISSIVHCSTFLSIDLEKSLYSLLQIASTASMLYVLVVGFLFRLKITTIIQQLSEIFEKPLDMEVLVNADNYCEWMWNIYFKFMLNGYNIFILVTSAMSVFFSQWINKKFNTKYLYHPFKLV